MKDNDIQTIKQMLEISALMYPDNIAFYEKEKKDYKGITYKQLIEDVEAFGTYLIENGLKDQKIGIIGKNSYEWAVAYLATVCGVGIAVPLDKQLSKEEIETSINRLGLGALVYSKEMDKLINKDNLKVDNFINMQTDMKEYINEGRELIKNGNSKFMNEKIDSNDPAVLLFTSGTTSESKIVTLSNRNIMHVVNCADQFLKVEDKDRFFSILPMHHTMECTVGFLIPISYGSSIIHCDSLKNIAKDMEKMKPSIIIGVPRILDLFDKKITSEVEKKGKTKLVRAMLKVTSLVPSLKKPIFKDIHKSFGDNLKTILVGGAPVNGDVSKRLRGYGFTVLQGYGLTECAPLVAANSEKDFKDTAAGKAVGGTDIKIVNIGEDGVGEIAVSGPQVMLGYYGNEEATKEAIKEDGYFYTGDLGYIDKKGFVNICGRSKNLIITSNGKNVYPEELESIISQNEMIKQSVVSAKTDSNGKEYITVEIVLCDELLKKIENYPHHKEEILKTVWAYISEINTKIAEYKRIQRVELKEEAFEETSTQKIKRYKK